MKISKKLEYSDEISYVHQLDDVNVSLQELEDAIKDFKSQRGNIRRTQIGNSDYYLIRYMKYISWAYRYKTFNTVFIQDYEGVQVHGMHDEGRGWTLVEDWNLKDTNQLKEELITLFNIGSKVS